MDMRESISVLYCSFASLTSSSTMACDREKILERVADQILGQETRGGSLLEGEGFFNNTITKILFGPGYSHESSFVEESMRRA